ncbi:MAG: metallophosphoesterase [Syntrophomonadaceae bacterium]|nr:metallophosphoesterase [Syntrophomonadaceae bacterium]
MSVARVAFLSVFLAGLRGWQALSALMSLQSPVLYGAVLAFLALSYLLAFLVHGLLPAPVRSALTWVGAYWMGVLFYALLGLLAIDSARLAGRWLDLLPARLAVGPALPGGILVVALAGLMVYGTVNALHPVVARYDITIAKPGLRHRELRAVMVSDLHLGAIVTRRRLEQLVEDINQRRPDLVLLAGDIIDGHLGPFQEQGMAAVLRRLQPPLGTYAVLGNHEYVGGHVEEIIAALSEAGVTVLRDQAVLVDGSFWVVGRDFRGRAGFGRKRLPLSQVMAHVDTSLPVLMLDHMPVDLPEAQACGVDLQLSGHTHRGQLFPNHLVTGRVFAVDWGYLRMGALQVLVSSGYGTWGPPLRVGNRPEVVEIRMRFAPAAAPGSGREAER